MRPQRRANNGGTVKFVLCLIWAAACGTEQAAQIDEDVETIESHAPAPIEQKMPLTLRCEGEFEGKSIKYELRKLPMGSLVYAVVGAVEASSVTQESSLMAQRIGLLVESDPPTFLRPQVGPNGFRLRAARLASSAYLPCWMP